MLVYHKLAFAKELTPSFIWPEYSVSHLLCVVKIVSCNFIKLSQMDAVCELAVVEQIQSRNATIYTRFETRSNTHSTKQGKISRHKVNLSYVHTSVHKKKTNYSRYCVYLLYVRAGQSVQLMDLLSVLFYFALILSQNQEFSKMQRM